MLSADLLADINQKYFHGELSDVQLSYLNDPDVDNGKPLNSQKVYSPECNQRQGFGRIDFLGAWKSHP